MLNLDNKYGKCCNCPALMGDQGRSITDYRSSKLADQLLMEKYKINDSNAFRDYIQKNALAYMKGEKIKIQGELCRDNNDSENKFYYSYDDYKIDGLLDDKEFFNFHHKYNENIYKNF